MGWQTLERHHLKAQLSAHHCQSFHLFPGLWLVHMGLSLKQSMLLITLSVSVHQRCKAQSQSIFLLPSHLNPFLGLSWTFPCSLCNCVVSNIPAEVSWPLQKLLSLTCNHDKMCIKTSSSSSCPFSRNMILLEFIYCYLLFRYLVKLRL